MALSLAQALQGGIGLGQSFRQGRKENKINALSDLLGSMQGGQLQSPEFRQLAALDAGKASRLGNIFGGIDDDRVKALANDTRQGVRLLESGNTQGLLDLLNNREADILRLGGNPDDVIEIKNQLLSGDIKGTLNTLRFAEKTFVDEGVLTDPRLVEAKIARATGKGSKQREFDNLVELAEADPEGKTTKGKAALIELGLIARVSTSASERIAGNKTLSDSIVKIEGEKAAAREGSKLAQQLKHKPSITKAVKLAEKLAIEEGDVLTSLKRSQAALPGLNTAVSELKELAQISTSTFGGKLFDAAVKQSGFGSTKGATARAKFIAIVNNQVLPLLKETFGAAFTFQEGESLKATMGDPDASADEKMVQLDAFIAQKMRDIETKQRQLNQPITGAAGLGSISDEDLKARLGL